MAFKLFKKKSRKEKIHIGPASRNQHSSTPPQPQVHKIQTVRQAASDPTVPRSLNAEPKSSKEMSSVLNQALTSNPPTSGDVLSQSKIITRLPESPKLPDAQTPTPSKVADEILIKFSPDVNQDQTSSKSTTVTPESGSPTQPVAERTPLQAHQPQNYALHPGTTAVSFLIGRQDPTSRFLVPQLFQISPKLLRQSRVLRKYQRHAHIEGLGSHNNMISLPNLDPYAFELYLEWVCMRTIVFPKRPGMSGCDSDQWTWQALWPLLNAHILATTLEDSEFQEYTLRLLHEKLLPNQPVDTETIRHVFMTPNISEELKIFLVDHAVGEGAENFRRNMLMKYPTAFVMMAVERSVEELDEWKRFVKPEEYMQFKKFKKQLSGDTLVSLQEELKQRKTNYHSGEGKAVAETNGVKTIDWAARCADTKLNGNKYYRNQKQIAPPELRKLREPNEKEVLRPMSATIHRAEAKDNTNANLDEALYIAGKGGVMPEHKVGVEPIIGQSSEQALSQYSLKSAYNSYSHVPGSCTESNAYDHVPGSYPNSSVGSSV
jgi:hypothetical protein